jgi:acyl-CoA dehydrogenase
MIGAAALGVLFGVPAVRRRALSKPLMDTMEKLGFLPTISDTEKTAIEAGTVWVDGELFSGNPDFERLLSERYPDLTDEERAFLDGPVEEVCRMTDDWDVFERKDLSLEVWDYLKKEKFFGMIIPEEYGGLGFSASANSAVVMKTAARSQVLGITVMVPNSLGPAELLIHYGTEEQKDYYLPRLADGREIPAFALTEPKAGSDAGSMTSTGEVFKGDDGELYVRLNWKKRYITLAAVSTVLGLAFKLSDPDNLLGKGENLGITCALVPTDIEGVELGKRHDPMGIPFVNCPTEGHDVVVPLEKSVIGGRKGAGQGWRMLMESLAAGRGISLPASAAGGAKSVYRVASAHAAVRKQFGLSIGKFEGIEEPLARIGGYTYIIEAARRYTNGGIDQGAKPAVVTAMMKYNTTELYREIINDGMDILAGNAISRGPRNTLAHAYQGTPISITVEGANILTRTLMVFGQGAIRCHPYALKEIEALENKDLKGFDKAFWGHIAHVGANKFRALLLSLSRGWLAAAKAPTSGPTAKYYRKLAWASASFAFMADVAMGTLGGNLKRKEKLTGRFADIFSWMYLGNAVLTRFEKEGRRTEDEPFMEWAMEYAFWQIQQAFDGIYGNFSVPGLKSILGGPVQLWSRLNPIGSKPSDYLGHKVAQAMQVPGPQRERHTAGIFVSDDPTDALGRLEHALTLHHQAEPVQRRIKDAVKAGTLPRTAPAKLVGLAVEKGIITASEADLVRKAEEARYDAIQVDAFTLEEYKRDAVAPEGAGGDGATRIVPEVRSEAQADENGAEEDASKKAKAKK